MFRWTPCDTDVLTSLILFALPQQHGNSEYLPLSKNTDIPALPRRGSAFPPHSGLQPKMGDKDLSATRRWCMLSLVIVIVILVILVIINVNIIININNINNIINIINTNFFISSTFFSINLLIA